MHDPPSGGLETLMPILQQIGLDTGPPQVMDVHEVIVPTPRAAAKKGKRARAAKRKR